MSTITERVAAGAVFLDEHDPDWWRAIDLDTLRLNDPDQCVLGQRCPVEAWRRAPIGESRFATYAAVLSGMNLREMSEWAEALGFEAGSDDRCCSGGEYDVLTAEWKRVITGRRVSERARTMPPSRGGFLANSGTR